MSRAALRLRAGVGLCIAAVAASGCTQRESHAQYQQRLTRSQQVVVRVERELARADLDDAQRLETMRRTVRDLADSYEQVGPPRRVDDAQRLYVAALRRMSRYLGQLVDCARRGQAQRGDGVRCRAAIDELAVDRVHNDMRQAAVMYRESGYKA